MKPASALLGLGVIALSLPAGVEGIRRFGRAVTGDALAAAPSPLLTAFGAVGVLVLGCWLCVALFRRRATVPLILAWSVTAAILAVQGHLNHLAYADHCRHSPALTPLTHRCVELQRRGRIPATIGSHAAAV